MRDDTAAPWSGLDRQALEYQFNPRVSVPDFARDDERRAPLNDAALAGLHAHRDLAYGDHPLRRVDVYPAAAPADGGLAPVHIFLHGGYWRALDRKKFAFIAGALVPRGITTVIADYELCPASTLDQVVDSALAGFAWICGNIENYGGDPARISISGHSAGAHLAAAILAEDWAARGQPQASLVAATLVSGVFDPTPAMHTSINQDLRLDAQTAARHNLEARIPRMACPISIVAGGREPPHWIDMSLRYGRNLQNAGLDPAIHVLPGCHHFNILDQYLDAASVVGRSIPG